MSSYFYLVISALISLLEVELHAAIFQTLLRSCLPRLHRAHHLSSRTERIVYLALLRYQQLSKGVGARRRLLGA
jgi:hypothetical protein